MDFTPYECNMSSEGFGLPSDYRDLLTPVMNSVAPYPSFKMVNVNNTLVPDPSYKVQGIEADVECLTYLLSVVANHMPSPSQLTREFLYPQFHLFPEIESITEEDLKSKMENLERQIKEMKRSSH